MSARAIEVVLVTATRLLVPIDTAVEWEWLEDALLAETIGSQVTYDGGEEEGAYQVHLFDQADAEQVLAIAEKVLRRACRRVSVAITGEGDVAVTEPRVNDGWLVALGPAQHPLDRAVKDLVKSLSADEALSQWWRSTGYGRVSFHRGNASSGSRPLTFSEQPDGGVVVHVGVDLTLLDVDRPSRTAVRDAARHSVRILIERLGDYVGRPAPRTPLLD